MTHEQLTLPFEEELVPDDQPDMVNHPPHYAANGPLHSTCGDPIECIDVAETLGFNKGNAVKYIWRASSKGTEAQDLQKAIWYLTRELENVEGRAHG